MCTKRRFYKSSFLVTCLLLFLFSNFAQPLYAKNVLARPRKMFLIKTEHFDIIYSNESEETALMLVENADRLYKEAAKTLNSENKLRMPVIISPDSDVLSVDYTSSPYNRIIIFDSPADYENAGFEDTLLSLFYREIFVALAQCVRSPFNQFVAKWIGQEYQPVALFNMPYSFIEGIAYIAEGEDGRLHDQYFLQLLAQAKLEGKFPKWIQVATVRDTYPGEELALAAGAGFAAFLMNTYGIEKYAQLWKESGKLNPLMTQGVFYKAYGIKLKELWEQFEASVPLPDKLAEIEEEGQKLFQGDKEANFEHLLLTDFGTVWYDRIRHEVDIYDEKNGVNIRQLLFLADNVARMSLSPDGRYISISHTQCRQMEGLSISSTWIYDLKTRKFLDSKYQLRDAAIVMTGDGRLAVAGVNVKDSHAKLEVYTMPVSDSKGEEAVQIYSKEFTRIQTPFSPVYAGHGFIAYILDAGTQSYLCRTGFEGEAPEESAESWLITTTTAAPLQLKRLAWNPVSRSYGSSVPLYTFAFTMPQTHSFTRTGFIYLSEDFKPQSIKLTSVDVSGGMNYAAVSQNGKTLYYSAKKYSINQLKSVAINELPVEDGVFQNSPANATGPATSANPHTPTTTLADYTVKRYNPLRYMADISITPFFPIKQIDLNEGNFYWPGLGLTVESQTDPCTNTRALLSAGWTYLPLDFSWTSNLPSSYLAKLRTESLNISKDKSAAFFIENSSTPVYLQAGCLFNCNLDGEYNFTVLGGGQWKLPVGIALRKLIFDFQFYYAVSTDYYDQTQKELRPSLSNWPSFRSAYELYQLSLKVQYTNIHQYGYSTFEKRGLLLGMRIYSMWDMYEVRLLQQARKEKEEKLQQEAQKSASSSSNELTNAQRKNLLSESLANITQLNAGLFATIAIPHILPLPMKNNWIINMPAQVKVEFVNKAGTALESSFEVLLIGREIHNSVIPSVLYSRRAGLWFGYNMALVYDTSEVRLPDIRHYNYLAEVFTGVSYTQAIYMILNLDLNVTLGKLSSVPINTMLQGTFFPESHGYDISLDVRFHL